MFTNDAVVLGLAIPLIFWVSTALVVDGGQAVFANALRGRQDVWVACVIQGVAFLGLMVPLSWLLAYDTSHGAAGLFQGVFIATTASILLLAARFGYLYLTDRAHKLDAEIA